MQSINLYKNKIVTNGCLKLLPKLRQVKEAGRDNKVEQLDNSIIVNESYYGKASDSFDFNYTESDHGDSDFSYSGSRSG